MLAVISLSASCLLCALVFFFMTVIGEKYDDEVNRWYTYDEDGVRYYNTRINQL